MKLSLEQYEKISKHLPKQRGNVRISNLQFLNAILYVAENGAEGSSKRIRQSAGREADLLQKSIQLLRQRNLQ